MLLFQKLWVLKRLHKPQYNQAKAGVCLSDLMPKASVQTDLFATAQSSSRSRSLMDIIDQIKSKMGRESIKLASEGVSYSWKMRSRKNSPKYTTNWSELVNII